MRARLGREFGADFDASSGVAFDALVSESSGAFELRLEARAQDGKVQERRIRATTCPELVDALVAAMSLAREALTSPESASEPPATPSKSESEPPVQPGRAPAPPAPAADDDSLVPVVALGAMLDVGALPSAAFGVEALAGLEWPSLDLWVFGGLTIPQQSTLEGGAGEFDLAVAGVSGCYTPERTTFELAGCLSGEGGRIRGVGVNVENGREGRSLWLAIAPSLRLRLRPSPRRWGVYAQLGAVVPLTRTPFELTDVGIVHEPAAVGLRAAVGIELAFQ